MTCGSSTYAGLLPLRALSPWGFEMGHIARRLLPLLAAVMIVGLASAPEAGATSACKRERLYVPRSGGHALIISRLRVSRITCAGAVRVAGAHSAGEPLPAKWRCRESNSGRSVCTRGKAFLSYISGGDAG